jgi:hypothetical protein
VLAEIYGQQARRKILAGVMFQNAPPFCIVTAPPLRLTFGKAFGVYETRAGNRKITHAAIRQTTGKPFTLHFN